MPKTTAAAAEKLVALREAIAEIEADTGGLTTQGLRLTIVPAISFSNPDVKVGLRIERETKTKTGRPGKPATLVLIVNSEGQRITDLLRYLADLIEDA